MQDKGYTAIEFPTYDTDWDSEAYASVSGQNSNNSIRVTDAFLDAVKNDEDWDLKNRVNGETARTIRAGSCGKMSATRRGLAQTGNSIS